MKEKPVYSFDFNMDIGLLLGYGYISWEGTDIPGVSEGRHVLDFGAIFPIKLGRRLLIIPQFGIETAIPIAGSNTDPNFGNIYYGGTRIGWVIHPSFSPFLGGGIFYKKYDLMLTEKNKSVFEFSFCAGAKLIKFEKSALWIILDYYLFNSDFQSLVLNAFFLNFAYNIELF